MATNFEDLQKFGKEQIDTVNSVAASLAKGFQTIAAETTDYSKRSLEASNAFLGKLATAKSIENAIQLQSEYAKAAYDSFVAQTKKISDLYADLAKDAFKPVESAITKAQSAVKSATSPDQ